MKTARNTRKNVCIKGPFLTLPKYILIVGRETPYLSGLPPDGRLKIHPELAVNMDEFPQFKGVCL